MPQAQQQTLPVSVTVASLVLMGYAVLHLTESVMLLNAIGAMDTESFARALGNQAVISIAAIVLAIYLRKARRWAWWVTVSMGILWGLGGLLVLRQIPDDSRAFSPSAIEVLTAKIICLWVVVVALLMPQARRTFGLIARPSGPPQVNNDKSPSPPPESE